MLFMLPIIASAGKCLRLLTPPVVLLIVRKVRPSKTTPKPEWEYISEGWSIQTRDPGIKGWNVLSIQARYLERLGSFQERLQDTLPFGISPESSDKGANISFHNVIMSYAYALLTASRQKSLIRILDWGGGIGQYYLLSKSIAPDLKIDYSCKELPVFIECGQQLFPEIHFYADETCLTQYYDLVLASSSLQYSEYWQDALSKLAEAVTQSGFLFITRTPTVFDVPSYVMIQRPYKYGYDTEYLGWCINHDELVNIASNAGLKLLREFVVEVPPYIYNAPEQCQYWGFLFKREANYE